MPQIYDIASKLDYSGVEAPARLNAARISIAEQTAREEPLRFAQQQKEWQRGDEQYQQQQEQYRQGQELARQQRLLTQVAQINATSITPQAFMRNAIKVLGNDINSPVFSSMMSSVASIGNDPSRWREIQPEIGGMLTNVNGLVAAQLKNWEQMNVEKERTSRSILEQASIAGREQSLEDKRQKNRIATETYKTQNRRAEIALRSSLQNQGIDSNEIAKMLPVAEQAMVNAFSEIAYETDPTTGEKRPVLDEKMQPVYIDRADKPKTEEEIFKWKMNWIQKSTHEINRIAKEEGGDGVPTTQSSGTKPTFSIMGPK